MAIRSTSQKTARRAVKPAVGIIMGSQSDWPTMQAAAQMLDALGIGQAHVVGASMGGMIAQHLAARHPERVLSLTLIMTTSGARHLPQPRLAVRQALLARPKGNDLASRVDHFVRLFDVIGSPAYPAEPARQRERLYAAARRAWRPEGTARQLVAVAADGDESGVQRVGHRGGGRV